MTIINVHIGYDSRFPLAYAVTARSMINLATGLEIQPILLPHLQGMGLYDRPMFIEDQQMVDEISDAPMATEFAISRFFIPLLNDFQGWSLFCDSDFLFRACVHDLMAQVDDKYAVMCVKHDHCPKEAKKMDGQLQTLYKRKNWSSMMLINNAHPKNKKLLPSYLNSVPGRTLHAFDWLDDTEIGEIGAEWNWLEGHSSINLQPNAVHYTRGTPDMEGYEDTPYSAEWWQVADQIKMCEDKGYGSR